MKRLINKVLSNWNHSLVRLDDYNAVQTEGKVLVNIGSGSWSCPGWTCLDYSTEWYSTAHKGVSYIEYDIRNDKLPFNDNSVDVFYNSHVVEHIENSYVQNMFREVYRSLVTGGVFRITCPDAEFLYLMTKLGKEYWEWRKTWYEANGMKWEEVVPADCLVGEVATSKLFDFYNASGEDYHKAFASMNMEDFLEYITSGLKFDVENVGNHINYWTFDKMQQMLQEAGFSKVVRSKYAGSVSKYMQSRRYFDTTHPEMSLYVEAVK